MNSSFDVAREKIALEYFHQGYSCAQSVFTAFHDKAGLTEAVALKISAGLGAGVGRLREVCGAFSALAMVAGLKEGNLVPTVEAKEKIYALVQRLAYEFKKENGSYICRELLHLDPETLEPARPSERTEVYYAERPCEKCIACAARLGAQLWKETEGMDI